MSDPRSAPIGVFDSGLGGLTVARAIHARLPHERLLYVGDTARVPYGPKSPETVRRYALQIGSWLVEQGVKAIVVACNTATAHALDVLSDAMPVPVLGVVSPGATAAVRVTRTGSIGVIGTSGTIASGAYARAIMALAPTAVVHGVACPLFVPLIEEGMITHAATQLIASDYLRPLQSIGVDTVVLGCTHYPLLRQVIAAEMGPQVTLIDSAAETARVLAELLERFNLLATSLPEPAAGVQAMPIRVVASDAPEHFRRMAESFLDWPLDHVEHHVFT
ncbi:MAG: glutamate racemase [Gemmatimonadaceae bacterium]|nr:glutamate racemase [Gemmatimonadaceae bacterium]